MATWSEVKPGDRILGKDGNVWTIRSISDNGFVDMIQDNGIFHNGTPDPTAEVEILPRSTEADAVRLITDTFGGTVHDPCPHCNGTGVIQ